MPTNDFYCDKSKKNKNKPLSFKKLRRQAEKRLLERDADRSDMPLTDILELIHELEVHQIELEMQNEELRQAQLDLEAARDKYTDLYDFAPIGYFSISDKELILDSNLVGASMLGMERRKLTGNLTVANVDSIGFVVRICLQCSAGKS